MDMSPAERHKYAEIFSSLNPINGYITGEYRLWTQTKDKRQPMSSNLSTLPYHHTSCHSHLDQLFSFSLLAGLFRSTGAQARQILMNSGVHINKLGQIWYVHNDWEGCALGDIDDQSVCMFVCCLLVKFTGADPLPSLCLS